MTANEARIRELESEITKRDNTILMQQNSINDLKRQVDNLTEILIQMRHDKFGPSSEKTVKSDDGSQQVSIFNEVEVEATLLYRSHLSVMLKVTLLLVRSGFAMR